MSLFAAENDKSAFIARISRRCCTETPGMSSERSINVSARETSWVRATADELFRPGCEQREKILIEFSAVGEFDWDIDLHRVAKWNWCVCLFFRVSVGIDLFKADRKELSLLDNELIALDDQSQLLLIV